MEHKVHKVSQVPKVQPVRQELTEQQVHKVK